MAAQRFRAGRTGAIAWHVKSQLGRRLSSDTPAVLARSARLVPSPIFLLSSVRSGSTLLRAILDSHSEIHAPHELHLGSLRVSAASWYGETAIAQLGLEPRDLENLLWDRVLHLELSKAEKSIMVDKTPYNTIDWRRVASAWPKARFIFLKRHPLRIFQSLAAARPDLDRAEHYENVIRYTHAFSEARMALPGPTVRYEDLTADPDRVVRDLCSWLEVEYEQAMLRYGDHEHGTFRRGVGDWGAKITSGEIMPAGPDPDPRDIPAEIHRSCQLLGYI